MAVNKNETSTLDRAQKITFLFDTNEIKWTALLSKFYILHLYYGIQ